MTKQQTDQLVVLEPMTNLLMHFSGVLVRSMRSSFECQYLLNY
jgi:hypothetical protein